MDENNYKINLLGPIDGFGIKKSKDIQLPINIDNDFSLVLHKENNLVTKEIVKMIGTIQNIHFETLDLSLYNCGAFSTDSKHLESKIKEYSNNVLFNVDLFQLSLWLIKPSLFWSIFLFISIYDGNDSLIATNTIRSPKPFSSYNNKDEIIFSGSEIKEALKYYSMIKNILNIHRYTKLYISLIELRNAIRESEYTRAIGSFINSLEMLLTNSSNKVRNTLITRINHILNSSEFENIFDKAYDIRSEYYHGTSLGEKKIFDLGQKAIEISYDFENMLRILFRTILNNESYLNIVTNDFYSSRQPEWKYIDKQNKT